MSNYANSEVLVAADWDKHDLNEKVNDIEQ